jgi:hypothetical protein
VGGDVFDRLREQGIESFPLRACQRREDLVVDLAKWIPYDVRPAEVASGASTSLPLLTS